MMLIRSALTALLLLGSSLQALAECHDDVITVFNRALSTGPVERSIVIGEAGGTPVSTAIVVPPDRVSTSVTDSYGDTSKVVLIGERGWQDGGKGWVEMPSDWAAQQLEAYLPPPQSVIDSIRTASCLGPMPAIDSGQVVYEITAESYKLPMTVRLEVARDTRLPQRIEIVEFPGDTMVITYRYDDTLTIEAPIASTP
jgi:hypothetical protein